MTSLATSWLPVRWLAALALAVGVLVVRAPAPHRRAVVTPGPFAPSAIHRCHRGQLQIDRDRLIATQRLQAQIDQIRRELDQQDRVLTGP